ncbi:MAG: transposase [Chroococcidiopsidaceae cyanobacterium CP_BM_RX_35]|nr:transposase [Chroococcidiopsidaceae cyanobacterium CP_BM_RX_35]
MMTSSPHPYKGYRFPAEIISHCVWLYYTFPLSYRDVEKMMLERGIEVTYESIREWCCEIRAAVCQSTAAKTSFDASLLAQLQQHPTLARVIELAQGFIQLVRQCRPQELDTWLEQANNSPLRPFQQFARTLQEDYAAVKAGVTLAVSNGQVEG